MKNRTRSLYSSGMLSLLAANVANLIGLFGELRWLIVVSIVLYVMAVGLMIAASVRFVNGRKNAEASTRDAKQ